MRRKSIGDEAFEGIACTLIPHDELDCLPLEAEDHKYLISIEINDLSETPLPMGHLLSSFKKN